MVLRILLLAALVTCVRVAYGAPQCHSARDWTDWNRDEIIGFGAGTTGGAGGPEITVNTAADLHSAVNTSDPKVVYIQGYIKLDKRVKVGNNTSIIGIGSTAELEGFGLQISNTTNVIVRNVGIWNVVDTDCISATFSDHIWIDHCEFWNERSRGFDYYDGLVE